MHTYQYYSTGLKSEVQVTFDKNGFLKEAKFLQEIEDDTKAIIFTKEKTFLAQAAAAKVKVTEIETTISFLQFWDAYKHKACGKSDAEKIWNKLTRIEQIEAFQYIPKLDSYLKHAGTAKPFATTYLNKKRWDQ